MAITRERITEIAVAEAIKSGDLEAAATSYDRDATILDKMRQPDNADWYRQIAAAIRTAASLSHGA